MESPEEKRLQGCIDDCTQEIKQLRRDHGDLRISLKDEISKVQGRLSVIESIVFGNGRPGLMALLDKQTSVLEKVNERLGAVEHSTKNARTRWEDKIQLVGIWIVGLGIVANILLNIFAG
jgi:hypothetical protein